MDKTSSRFARMRVTCIAVVVGICSLGHLLAPPKAHAQDSFAGLPAGGLMTGKRISVVVKNPDGITQKYDQMGRGVYTLYFDSTCDVGSGSEYRGVARHKDGRILVELGKNVIFDLDDGSTPCPTGTLFWRSRQQFEMAARAWQEQVRKAEEQLAERWLIGDLLRRAEVKAARR